LGARSSNPPEMEIVHLGGRDEILPGFFSGAG